MVAESSAVAPIRPQIVERSSLPAAGARLDSIDLVRGLVMVIMALDHVRDYFHSEAQLYSPEDLAHTDGILFFTRWITHFCAPVFVFLAGTSAYLYAQRGRSTGELSRFLLTRGLWLIVLELTVVISFGWRFGIQYDTVFLRVIWALGCSMVALAALVWLPWRVLLVLSLAIIGLHNTLDGITTESFGSFAWLWALLHVQSFFDIPGGPTVRVAYPLLAWVGVMALGYCFGSLLTLAPDRRRSVLIRLGAALTVSFVALRWSNLHGDPNPWAVQDSVILTVISFFNTAKYPPSLLYLLMTLGPALLLLGLIDRVRLRPGNFLLVFGRVPLFYYLLHIPLIHALALIFAHARYGNATFMLEQPPSLSGPADLFPADYGYDLWVTYVVWIGVVAALYPLCRWYAGLKQRNRSALLTYL
jgi:uncharacterized membrane protein